MSRYDTPTGAAGQHGGAATGQAVFAAGAADKKIKRSKKSSGGAASWFLFILKVCQTLRGFHPLSMSFCVLTLPGYWSPGVRRLYCCCICKSCREGAVRSAQLLPIFTRTDRPDPNSPPHTLVSDVHCRTSTLHTSPAAPRSCSYPP